ncbi:MAG: LysR family transcriptional regulator [Myxococcales bacterium]|nr:LysR family transcriptional regulator [Myxococcales bacterium]
MNWLNYQHLYYFSVIASEGGIAPAARKLKLTHSTLSAQLKSLEAHLGTLLFDRRGKRLWLTSFGQEALSYAVDIFRLGRELNESAQGRLRGRRKMVVVGVAPSIPKSLIAWVMETTLASENVSVQIRQDDPPVLLERLMLGRCGMVITNDPPQLPRASRLHVQILGNTGISLYAHDRLARGLKKDFPAGINGKKLVMPMAGGPLRKALDHWLLEHELSVEVVAETNDAGIMRALGTLGTCILPVRGIVRKEVEGLHGLRLLGECVGVRETYYAVTAERKSHDEPISAILRQATRHLEHRH